MKKDTQSIHAGLTSGISGATVPPVCQSVAFAYDTARELADAFEGKGPGYIYSRLGNPTNAALEARLTHLENGVGCIATSSGMAAISSVAMGLLKTGDEILAAKGIFGGTTSLFCNTLKRFGIETRLFDPAETDDACYRITDKTRLLFVESIGNPGMEVPDIPALAEAAHEKNIPFVVDNTAATPMLVRPGDLGADIVVHSTSKFINGHGTAIGGAIIDCGNYNWHAGIFEDIRRLSQTRGQLAFLWHLRNLIYRDLGGCPAPMNSFLMLQGLETLPARMKIICENAAELAKYLQRHPQISWVNYPALEDSRFKTRVDRIFGGLGGGLLTFGTGSKEKAFRFIDATELALNTTNLGDVKTLVIHPASTIFHEFGMEERQKMGVGEDMVRVSVGIESVEDIKDDFTNALILFQDGA